MEQCSIIPNLHAIIKLQPEETVIGGEPIRLNFGRRVRGERRPVSSLDMTSGCPTEISNSICQAIEFKDGCDFFAFEHAHLLVLGVVRALQDVSRPKGAEIELDDLDHYLSLENVSRLCDEQKYPEVSEFSRNTILGYLALLPGFDLDLGVRQSREVAKHHRRLSSPVRQLLESIISDAGEVSAA